MQHLVVFILLIFKIFIKDGRFSKYIFTEYIKITAFQTSPVKKAGRNYCKFQAETRIKISK